MYPHLEKMPYLDSERLMNIFSELQDESKYPELKTQYGARYFLGPLVNITAELIFAELVKNGQFYGITKLTREKIGAALVINEKDACIRQDLRNIAENGAVPFEIIVNQRLTGDKETINRLQEQFIQIIGNLTLADLMIKTRTMLLDLVENKHCRLNQDLVRFYGLNPQ